MTGNVSSDAAVSGGTATKLSGVERAWTYFSISGVGPTVGYKGGVVQFQDQLYSAPISGSGSVQLNLPIGDFSDVVSSLVSPDGGSVFFAVNGKTRTTVCSGFTSEAAP